MAEQTVTLRLQLKAAGTVAGVQKVTDAVKSVGTEAERAGARTETGFGRARRGVESISTTLQQARQQLLQFFGVQLGVAGARNIARLADDYTNLQSRIRLVTNSQQQANVVGAQVFDIAQRTRSELSATGQLYTTLARSTADLGLSQQQLAQITQTVNQSFVVSGAAAESARAAIVQLSQGLASGALRGDEFNSVAEQAPILLDLVARSLGKSRGELREFAAQSGITAKILTDALLGGAADVQRQFDGMAVTISGASTQVSNAFTRFVGETSATTGAASGLAGAMQFVARHFDRIAAVALSVGAIFGVRLVARLGASAVAWGANNLQVLAYNASLLRLSATSPVVVAGLRAVTAGAVGLSAAMGPISIALTAVAAGVALFAATADRSATSIDAEIDRLRQQNDELREQARLRKLIAEGNADEQSAGPAKAFDDAIQAVARFDLQIQQLSAVRKGLAKFGNDTAGIDAAILGLRAQISGTIGDIGKLGELLGGKFALTGSIDELPPKFRATAQAILDANKRVREFLGLSRAVAQIEPPKFSDDLAKSLTERVATLKAERIELTQGKRARLEFEALQQTGAQSVEQLDERLRKLIGSVAAESAAVDAAKEVQKRANDEREKSIRTADEAREAGEAFRVETAKLQAELAGPSAQAFAEFSGEIDNARVLLLAGGISVDAFIARARVARETLDRTNAAIAAQRAPIDQMLDDLRLEAELIGLGNTEREVAIALRQIEQDQIANSKTLTQAQIDQRKAEVEATIRSNEAQRQAVEIAQQAADDYQRAWQGATDSVLRSFGEFVARGANNFKSLGRQLKDIARSFLADLVALFLRNTLLLRVGVAGVGTGAAGAAVAGVPGAAGGGGILGALGGLGSLVSGGIGSGLLGAGAGIGGAFGGGLAFAGGAVGNLGLLGGLGASGAAGLGNLAAGNLLLGAGQLLPVAGAIFAAAKIVDSLTGGGLFGTRFKTVSSGREISIDDLGASGFQFEEQKKKKAFFRGTKRRTLTSDIDDDTQQAIEDLFNTVEQAMAAAASALAVEIPPLVSGTFRQEFDKKGNLSREFSSIAGRIVEESQAAFQQRLQAENILAVIAQSAPSAQQLAEPFRANAEDLLDAAQLMLAAQVAINQGVGLIGEDLGETVEVIQSLARAGEPLAEAFARAAGATALLEQALSLSGVALDRTRVELVTFAADIAESAGGLDAATALWRGYFDRFFDDNERAVAALEQARTAAAQQVGDVGLDATAFAGAAGLAQFRALFEDSLPTLGADAVVQWLEAAQALVGVIDAQDALNQTLGQAEQVAGEATQALADLLADIRGQASGAAVALAEFDLSPLAQSINAVARETQAAIDEATRLGATEADLAEIRALGSARAELLQRQAQRELSDLLSGVSADLAEFDLSPLEVELSRIDRAMRETLDQAAALGATEAQLATIRDLASRRSAQAVEAEAERLRAAFAQLAESIGRVRGSIADDILSLRRAAPGFDEAAFQTGRLADLRAALDAATDPTERVDLIDQVRQATLGRYNAELAAIEQAQQAQQVAAQEAQRGIEAQREALNRLRGFVDTLGLSSASPLTAFQRLDEARSVFDRTLSRARGGDVDAIGGLQEAANALLTENRAVFGVSDVAVREFERVRSALSGIAGQGVRGAAAISDPFQRASLDTSARIAALQASTIAELQGLDDALAMLEITQQADTEGTIQALRDRFDQAETHQTEIIEHIQPIVDVLARADDTGQSQLVELRAQTAALQGVIAGIEDQTSLSSAFLDKIAVNLDTQEQRINALIERLGRAIERTAGSGVRL